MENDICKEIICNGEVLILSPRKAVYWPSQKALILADLHLGKSAYFRNHGIAIPSTVMEDDLKRLSELLESFSAEKIMVVGDMFHHSYNADIQIFKEWRQQFPNSIIELIPGNHDKLLDIDYNDLNISVTAEKHIVGRFMFIHKPINDYSEHFVICGHLHPGYLMAGRARQTMRLPCFIKSENQLILPAFSAFTGLFTNYEKENECNYFIVGGNKIFCV